MNNTLSQSIGIPVDLLSLNADLIIPKGTKGIVVFAHGSGSSRFSPRNKFVANELNKAGLATALVDLLTNAEEKQDLADASLRFNIKLLANRLVIISRWLVDNSQTSGLGLGYFGASTGAAAALMAAAEFPKVSAIVSRGGRPDLAGESLSKIKIPTLLIVGQLDEAVIGLNQKAFDQLASEQKELKIITGATHLFGEPGTLEEVSRFATNWFSKYL
jgi:putative phosphoribosyl transferase